VSTLRDHYEALAGLDPAERRARLHALNLPEEQHRRLRAMLEPDTARLDPLEVPLDRAIRDLGERDLAERLIGTRVGPFRVLEALGEGGSAVVFKAERAAGSGSQFVALKLLRAGLFSGDAERRFRREQAILAQLTHPNIARLIEADVSEAGIPYIALEYVDGVPITEAASARSLDLRARLRLIARLCRSSRCWTSGSPSCSTTTPPSARRRSRSRPSTRHPSSSLRPSRPSRSTCTRSA
jgi:hypothetical protein